ncbi:MAG: N-acetylmuramoyl-L-alanine amidase [Acidobacteriota bacterium]
MQKQKRKRLAARALVFAMVFYLAARPTLNAADPVTADRGPRSLAEKLFQHANSLSSTLHNKPFDDRTDGEYLMAIDSYNQVALLNTDSHFAADALARIAELQREMAHSTGDSALYQKAIDTFRLITAEHPNSAFVGDALIQIARIYEENLQDLDGAAAAYREMIEHFPSSVLAREARAVLARLDAQLANRPVDVVVPLERVAQPEGIEGLQITNVRNFSGPDYARVVVDLSGEVSYSERRAGESRFSIQVNRAAVSPSLYGRRFIVPQSTLLRRIVVSEQGASVTIDMDVSSLAEYSTFSLSEPDRLVIDLHGANSIARARMRESALALRAANEARKESSSKESSSGASIAKPARSNWANQKPLLGLPEINDPILMMGEEAKKDEAKKAENSLTEKLAVEKQPSDSPIKCIVIDPGHGGHDTGTISPTGMREKDLVLDVARRLRAYIKRNYPDIEVILTRESDRFVALEERTAIANSRGADLFISIHANASAKRAASGVETFFVSPDRAGEVPPPNQAAGKEVKPATQNPTDKAQPMFASVTVGNRVAASRELARYIQSGLVRGIGAHSPDTAANRGVKHAPFAVLRGSAMPSVLAEVSFLSNPRDEALLQTGPFRERIAASLFAGLNAYLKKNRPVEAKK